MLLFLLALVFSSTAAPSRPNRIKKNTPVYERHLHPSRYRTRPCAEGASCTRRVCFFAHGPGELRAPTHDRMTPSDAEAIRRTRLAAIAGDAAQPPALREQAAALYEGKVPPLASSSSRGGECGGRGRGEQHVHSRHHDPRSSAASLFGGGGGSGDYSSSSRGGRGAEGGMESMPHSGPGTPLSSTSMGGGGVAGASSSSGGEAAGPGFPPLRRQTLARKPTTTTLRTTTTPPRCSCTSSLSPRALVPEEEGTPRRRRRSPPRPSRPRRQPRSPPRLPPPSTEAATTMLLLPGQLSSRARACRWRCAGS